MTTPLKLWVAGARPRTLPAAVVPVVVGTAAGYVATGHYVTLVAATNQHVVSSRTSPVQHSFSAVNAILALIVAVALQIGTNYVNDYADGVRGTDEVRVGPVRLVAGKLATVRQVKLAALTSFGLAGIAGLILAVRVSYWFIPIGLLCGVACPSSSMYTLCTPSFLLPSLLPGLRWTICMVRPTFVDIRRPASRAAAHQPG